MKKMIFMAALLLGVVTTNAQEEKKAAKTPEERATKQTERLEKELKLTPEQTAKVKEINLNAAKKVDGIKNTATEERKEKKDQLKAIEEEKETQLATVLTPEQMQEYKTMKEKMKEKREERKHKKQGDQKKELK